MRDTRITVGEMALHGRLLLPDAPPPYAGLLFIHGWGSSQRQDIGKAKQLATLRFACVTFNLRGHARTRTQVETVTRADNLADAVAAYDRLAAADGVDHQRIGVVGSSYGGYLAVLLTAERPVRWLALQAPALYKDADFDRPKRQLNLDPDLPAYRRRRLDPDDNRALRAATAFDGDVLLVESEHDSVIPGAVIANYREAFRGAASVTHKVLAGADHGLSSRPLRRTYGALLVEWFDERLGLRAASEHEDAARP
jgi:pimeloyl-ACP methyl ester carboxylesterase